MSTPSGNKRQVSDSVYLELVASVLGNLIPTSIMSLLFLLVAVMATWHHPDSYMFGLAIAGSAASVARMMVVVAQRYGRTGQSWTLESAKGFEKLFASTYVAFAALLGLFAARAMLVCGPEIQMLLAVLIVGYAAGVAAGVSLRPRISLLALASAVMPMALASAMVGDPSHAMLAFMLIALLAGGITSIRGRYRWTSENIAMRHLLGTMARHDPLTGLANRLGLADAYTRARCQLDQKLLAVHCLDLDRFKPVNDRYGHPVGDRLLQMVAQRLSKVVASNCLPCRLGGDEFVLLQTSIGHADEVEMVRRRIIRSLERPYQIDAFEISIGVSVGSAIAEDDLVGLDTLLKEADAASYEAKGKRRRPAWRPEPEHAAI